MPASFLASSVTLDKFEERSIERLHFDLNASLPLNTRTASDCHRTQGPLKTNTLVADSNKHATNSLK
jgi:hypothetical protein